MQQLCSRQILPGRTSLLPLDYTSALKGLHGDVGLNGAVFLSHRGSLPRRQQDGADRHAAPHQCHQRQRWVCDRPYIPHWPPCCWYACAATRLETVQLGWTQHSRSSLTRLCVILLSSLMNSWCAYAAHPNQPPKSGADDLGISMQHTVTFAPTVSYPVLQHCTPRLLCRCWQSAVGHPGNPRAV